MYAIVGRRVSMGASSRRVRRARAANAAPAAYDLCHDLTWSGGTVPLAELSPFLQSKADPETIVHHEMLRRCGEANSDEEWITRRK